MCISSYSEGILVEETLTIRGIRSKVIGVEEIKTENISNTSITSTHALAVGELVSL